MARDQCSTILHAGPPLGRRFRQVADLVYHGQAGATRGEMDRLAEPERVADGSTGHGGPSRAAQQARPGLSRADARRELPTTGRAADEIGTDVGGPYADYDPEHGFSAVHRLMAQPEQRHYGRERVQDG